MKYGVNETFSYTTHLSKLDSYWWWWMTWALSRLTALRILQPEKRWDCILPQYVLISNRSLAIWFQTRESSKDSIYPAIHQIPKMSCWKDWLEIFQTLMSLWKRSLTYTLQFCIHAWTERRVNSLESTMLRLELVLVIWQSYSSLFSASLRKRLLLFA